MSPLNLEVSDESRLVINCTRFEVDENINCLAILGSAEPSFSLQEKLNKTKQLTKFLMMFVPFRKDCVNINYGSIHQHAAWTLIISLIPSFILVQPFHEMDAPTI